LGDQIIIEETEDNVERIELRATHPDDGRPNSETFTSPVNTTNPLRRAPVRVYSDYDIAVARCFPVLTGLVGCLNIPAALTRC
jgi:hypothetical protein